MSASEFDNYKVDHLFLLIGENPLPNYVAAKLLLNKHGTVYLVHTRDTKERATRLQSILIEEQSDLKAVEFRSLSDYESDAHYIKTEINKTLETISSGKVGLNYTGGTKAMSVHAYRTLFYEEIEENNKSKHKKYKRRYDVILSYLDPRRLEICIDSEDGERERIKIKPATLEIKLVKLFNLHGLNLKNEPVQEAQLPDFVIALAQLFSDDIKRQLWFSGFYKEFCEQARKKKSDGSRGDWKSQTSLMAVSVSLEKLPEYIVAAFQKENFATDNKLTLKEVHKTNIFKKLDHFCEWLDGLWLEHYVLHQVKNIAQNQLIHDYGMDFEIPLEGTKDGFQFDVAFTRGHQLFAISCTTSRDRKLCKSKLFEAYLRARQMGGDEARAALVCISDEPDSLKAEISDVLANKKIAVFGCEDLIDLSKKISDWITQNDQEAK
ncbi:hypothetical protein FACHB389_01400 [Nostoc calcicola FACHB-389]|nr:DUF1887 family protein [Nostoc calcicola FACHB-3891]OKH42338.1 hypothetical protein FACHB389_01400 [Nostoc calcicola FACHB-389]